MRLDAISPQLVDKTLRALQQAKELPKAWQESYFLQEDSMSLVELRYRLYDHLCEVVQEGLSRHRWDAGLGEPVMHFSQQDLKAALAADFSVGRSSLEAWSALYYRYLALPDSDLSREELAEAAHVEAHQFRRRVRAGLSYLTDLLRRSEREAHREFKKHYLCRDLPAPDYGQLFGVCEPLQQLINRLQAKNGPAFISLEGMGGIGKTALAQEVAFRLAEVGQLAGLAWISARQESFTLQGEVQPLNNAARSLEDVITRLVEQLNQRHLVGLTLSEQLKGLQPLLTSKPHLIVIDNLETLTDSEALLSALQPLAGVTRFLLTSRVSLQDLPYVQVISLPELSASASQKLLEHEIRRRGQHHLLTKSAMHSIYETIGGLPLALKLVASQLGILPLDHILHSLQAPHEAPEAMYRYIYWQSWQLLNDDARQLLGTMRLISPEGEDVTWLRLISRLPNADFTSALNQLRYHSLIETRGTLEVPIYKLHRLTSTFLQNNVFHSQKLW